MIKELSDFKSATKRIPKLLQTFDLSKPNIFNLSNSAALNLMARILGYENYNTIKSVFKNISKGKKRMKRIETSKDMYLNTDHIISYCKEVSKNIHEYSKTIYQIKILASEYEGHHLEYDFSSDENATKFLKSINDFLDGDTSLLRLDTLYQQLKNTDNRANQINSNNHST